MKTGFASCSGSSCKSSRAVLIAIGISWGGRRRTRVVRIFPNHDSCLLSIRALAVETREDWLEANRYLCMDYLRELKKEELRKAA